jgi:hypothetical protein
MIQDINKPAFVAEYTYRRVDPSQPEMEKFAVVSEKKCRQPPNMRVCESIRGSRE